MSKKKLTVVQVLPALESGGVERGTLEVGKYLVEQGHKSIVISIGGRMVKTLEQQGSRHIQWDIGRKSPSTLQYIVKLQSFIKENKVDIVHVRSRFPAWVCYFALKFMNKETRPLLVTTVHGAYSVNAYSAVMTKGDRVIVISETIKKYVVENYPAVNPAKLYLNYRGIDPKDNPRNYQPNQQWLQSWYQSFPASKDKLIISLPGRITRRKGQEDFIEIIAQLQKQGLAVHGLIIGETKKDKGHFLQELKAKANSLGIGDHITFTGHRSDLREIMAISKIVMSLSIEPEAFGRTTIEALSLGIPVIGYDHGGVGEQLRAMLPKGCIAIGNTTDVSKLCKEWLKQPPIIPESHPFLLQTMLENTLNIYSGTSIQTQATEKVA